MSTGARRRMTSVCSYCLQALIAVISGGHHNSRNRIPVFAWRKRIFLSANYFLRSKPTSNVLQVGFFKRPLLDVQALAVEVHHQRRRNHTQFKSLDRLMSGYARIWLRGMASSSASFNSLSTMPRPTTVRGADFRRSLPPSPAPPTPVLDEAGATGPGSRQRDFGPQKARPARARAPDHPRGPGGRGSGRVGERVAGHHARCNAACSACAPC